MQNPPCPPGLIQRYQEELQARHPARRTVATDEQWLRRQLRFHGMRPMGEGQQRGDCLPPLSGGGAQRERRRRQSRLPRMQA